MAKKSFLTPDERKQAMIQLTGHALQGLVTADAVKGKLPHEMLADNLAREAVRFAKHSIDHLEQSWSSQSIT